MVAGISVAAASHTATRGTGPVHVENRAPLLVLMKMSLAKLKLAVVAAVGPCKLDSVPLQLWASQSVMFPELDSAGLPNCLPANFAAYNSIRASSRPNSMQQTCAFTCLPAPRSVCAPAVVKLATSAFWGSSMFPKALAKAEQSCSDASLCAAAALAYAQQEQGGLAPPK